MKTPLAMIGLAALFFTFSGCGGTNRPNSVSGARSAVPAASIPRAGSNARVELRTLEQDEDDDDDRGEAKGFDSKDADADGDNDHPKPRGYYDPDDGGIRAYGHAPSAAEKLALTTLVTRYFVAADTRDGARACSMLAPVLAASIVKDYARGSSGGPAYLRRASTCAGVLALFFGSLRAELSSPIEVILVRVNGNRARVLVSAHNMPASFLELERERRGWRSLAIVGTQLP